MQIVSSANPATVIDTRRSFSSGQPVAVSKSLVVMLPTKEISGDGVIMIGGGGRLPANSIKK